MGATAWVTAVAVSDAHAGNVHCDQSHEHVGVPAASFYHQIDRGPAAASISPQHDSDTCVKNAVNALKLFVSEVQNATAITALQASIDTSNLTQRVATRVYCAALMSAAHDSRRTPLDTRQSSPCSKFLALNCSPRGTHTL